MENSITTYFYSFVTGNSIPDSKYQLKLDSCSLNPDGTIDGYSVEKLGDYFISELWELEIYEIENFLNYHFEKCLNKRGFLINTQHLIKLEQQNKENWNDSQIEIATNNEFPLCKGNIIVPEPYLEKERQQYQIELKAFNKRFKDSFSRDKLIDQQKSNITLEWINKKLEFLHTDKATVLQEVNVNETRAMKTENTDALIYEINNFHLKWDKSKYDYENDRILNQSECKLLYNDISFNDIYDHNRESEYEKKMLTLYENCRDEIKKNIDNKTQVDRIPYLKRILPQFYTDEPNIEPVTHLSIQDAKTGEIDHRKPV